MKRALLTLLLCSTFASAEMSPAAVKHQIEEHGVNAFQAQVSESDWHSIIATKVAEGDAEWIAILPWFRALSNNEKTADLVEAAQRGLIRNPQAMLEALNSIDKMTPRGKVVHLDTDNICFGSIPDISKHSYLLFYAATKHALEEANNLAAKCLWVLDSVHDELMAEDRNGTKNWGTRAVPSY